MSGAQHTTQHTATQSGLLGYVALDAAYYNSIPDEVYLRQGEIAQWESIEDAKLFADQPDYSAADREKIRIQYILSTHYHSPYAEDGASKRTRRRKRRDYRNGGAARNRLLDAQNGYGGRVPEYYQQENLACWAAESIEGKGVSELRQYMALWLSPLITVGNIKAIKAILRAYHDALQEEQEKIVKLLACLNVNLDSDQSTDDLEQFVASLARTKETDEAGLKASESSDSVPPTAPIAPPKS